MNSAPLAQSSQAAGGVDRQAIGPCPALGDTSALSACLLDAGQPPSASRTAPTAADPAVGAGYALAPHPPWAFNESAVALTIADGFGHIIAANAAALGLLEATTETLLGAELATLIEPPPTASGTRSCDGGLEALLGDGWPRTLEREHRTPSGTRRWVRQTIVPQRGCHGQIDRILVRWDDITPTRTGEERLRRAAHAFEHAPAGMLLIDRQARIIDANPAFSMLTGQARDDAIGRDVRQFDVDPHGRGLLADAWEQLPGRDAWEGTLWTRRRNGIAIALRVCIRVIKAADEAVDGHVALLTDITAKRREWERLEREARHDALTGLPNRVLLEQRLAFALHGARRRDHCLALAYIDLDDFKAVNDEHGHEVGDHFLVEVADRMLGSLREEDTVARVGGDEFVVIISDPRTASHCESIVARLHQALSGRITLAGHRLGVSASIGVAMTAPEERIDARALLRRADRAMYLAKRAGKGGYRIWRGPGHPEEPSSRDGT